MANDQSTERRWVARRLEDDPEFCRLCRGALEKLGKALDLHPPSLLDEVDIAENAVAGLRDMLISRYRQPHGPEEGAEIKRLLDRVNTALSLIAGVVYPSSGIERSSIEEAYKVLDGAAGPCGHRSTEGKPNE